MCILESRLSPWISLGRLPSENRGAESGSVNRNQAPSNIRHYLGLPMAYLLPRTILVVIAGAHSRRIRPLGRNPPAFVVARAPPAAFGYLNKLRRDIVGSKRRPAATPLPLKVDRALRDSVPCSVPAAGPVSAVDLAPVRRHGHRSPHMKPRRGCSSVVSTEITIRRLRAVSWPIIGIAWGTGAGVSQRGASWLTSPMPWARTRSGAASLLQNRFGAA